MEHLIGFDIGGTKTAVILGKSHGREISILKRQSFPTEAAKGPGHAIGRMLEIAREMIAGSGSKPVAAGISCGGPLDSRRGLVLSPPNLPGWDAVPIVELCSRELGIPARLQNDANACALAEWRWGAARGCANAVFLTFGTGMGAGLILNGRLYDGANGMAGEVGHIRMERFGPVGYGKTGSFEGFCSGGGIAQLARALALEQLQQGRAAAFCPSIDDLAAVDARMVAEAAAAGDGLALEVFRICGGYLGRGLSVLVDILNPEIIVIGSIFARCEGLLRESMEQEMERECLALSRGACRVVPAALGEAIGDMAALAVALED